VGDTALHRAVEWGQREIAVLLCEHGVRIDAKGQYGLTPVQNAQSLGYLDPVEVLRAAAAKRDAEHKGKARP